MPKKAQDGLLHGLGKDKVRVDYVTVDGRETYWYIEWEGALAAVQRRYQELSPTLSARSWPATSPSFRARPAAASA